MFIPFLLLQTLVLELVWQSSCWLSEGQNKSKHPPCVPSCLHMSDCTPAALHSRPRFLAHVQILYFCTENTYTVNYIVHFLHCISTPTTLKVVYVGVLNAFDLVITLKRIKVKQDINGHKSHQSMF